MSVDDHAQHALLPTAKRARRRSARRRCAFVIIVNSAPSPALGAQIQSNCIPDGVSIHWQGAEKVGFVPTARFKARRHNQNASVGHLDGSSALQSTSHTISSFSPTDQADRHPVRSSWRQLWPSAFATTSNTISFPWRLKRSVRRRQSGSAIHKDHLAIVRTRLILRQFIDFRMFARQRH